MKALGADAEILRECAVSPAAFADHCAGGQVLTYKRGAAAVVAHDSADGRTLITKIWRRDRGLISALKAYHERFRRALATLERLGIPVPRYRAHGRVLGSAVRYVIYERLEGTPLRGRGDALDVDRLARFVAHLHAEGVYFRGLHLGNVLETPDGRLGLIDVQDVRFRGRPLSLSQRARNLGILCAHPGDLVDLAGGRWAELVLAYCRVAGFSVSQAARMRDRVHAQIGRRSARRTARRLRRGLPPLPKVPV